MLKRDLSMSPSAAKLAVAQEKPPLAVPAKCTTLFAPTAGAACKVPFEPREDRPVYCSECFANMKAE